MLLGLVKSEKRAAGCWWRKLSTFAVIPDTVIPNSIFQALFFIQLYFKLLYLHLAAVFPSAVFLYPKNCSLLGNKLSTELMAWAVLSISIGFQNLKESPQTIFHVTRPYLIIRKSPANFYIYFLPVEPSNIQFFFNVGFLIGRRWLETNNTNRTVLVKLKGLDYW